MFKKTILMKIVLFSLLMLVAADSTFSYYGTIKAVKWGAGPDSDSDIFGPLVSGDVDFNITLEICGEGYSLARVTVREDNPWGEGPNKVYELDGYGDHSPKHYYFSDSAFYSHYHGDAYTYNASSDYAEAWLSVSY